MSVYVTRPRIADPFVFLLALCALSGVTLLAGGPEPGSIEATLPVWAAHTWGGFLAGGSLLAMLGVFWPDHGRWSLTHALMIERLGLTVLGGAGFVYALAVLVAAGPGGRLAGGIIGYFTVVCVSRAWKIGQAFRLTVKAVTK